jgi:hypothetical protein
MGSPAAEATATCELLDGRLVSVRHLCVDDAEAVVALHQSLSDHDRYLRFFTLNPAHLNELVGKLIEPGVGDCAVGAFDADRLIGVANYAVSDDPTVADIAVIKVMSDLGWPSERLSSGPVCRLQFRCQIKVREQGVRDVQHHSKIRSVGLCRWIGGI